MKSTYPNIALFLISFLLLLSCKKTPETNVSFYYWKTTFAISTTEQALLQSNDVKEVYTRYFDIIFDKKTNSPVPRGIIQWLHKQPWQCIPVIYIKNEVFEQQRKGMLDTLCTNIQALVQHINQISGQKINTVQFDCDWSIKTKENYFYFLKKYKQVSGLPLSATIRLHQIKYCLQTGVPPVEKGVLMFYNMGSISADSNNSIYDYPTSEKYLSRLDSYPMELDIALPIFSWSIQIRNGQVVHLLNKMNDTHFNKDAHFRAISDNRYKVAQSFFKGGYYFKEGDEIKVEKITPETLKVITEQINKHKSKHTATVIFYDLDTFNTKNYDQDIYKEIARRLN